MLRKQYEYAIRNLKKYLAWGTRSSGDPCEIAYTSVADCLVHVVYLVVRYFFFL